MTTWSMSQRNDTAVAHFDEQSRKQLQDVTLNCGDQYVRGKANAVSP